MVPLISDMPESPRRRHRLNTVDDDDKIPEEPKPNEQVAIPAPASKQQHRQPPQTPTMFPFDFPPPAQGDGNRLTGQHGIRALPPPLTATTPSQLLNAKKDMSTKGYALLTDFVTAPPRPRRGKIFVLVFIVVIAPLYFLDVKIALGQRQCSSCRVHRQSLRLAVWLPN